MAGSFAKLVVSLGANISSFETDMKRAATLSKRELGKMERQAKQLNDAWNRNFKLAFAGVVAGLAASTKAAAEFENAMAEVSTLLDDTSGMDRLSKSVRDLSVQFGQAPTDQARALYQVISAGASDSRTQIEQLTAANKLAVGGVTDVATAADGLTTVLNAYAGTGLTAQRATDILFSTMRGGKTTIGEMSSSIGVVASTAAQVGVSMEELGAAIATVTKATGSTERTMTGLRATFNAVLAQTPQTVAAAKELGISFDIAGRGADGFKELLDDIAKSNATDEQLKRLLGSTEALSAFLPLINQDVKEFGSQLENAANSAGMADKAFEKMAEQAKFKADQARQAFADLQIEIGQRFLSSVSTMAVAFVDNIDDMVRAVEIMVAFISGRALIAVVSSFAQMAAAGKAAATTMAILGGAVGASAAALGSIAAIVYNNVEQTNRMDFALAAMTGTLQGATAEWLKNADAVERAAVSEQVIQAQIDAADRIAVIAERMAQLRKNVGTATDQLQFNAEFKALEEELADLTKGIEDADTVLGEIKRTFISTGGAIGDFVNDVFKAGDEAEGAAKKTDKLTKALIAARKAYAEGKVWDDFAKRLKAAGEVINDTNKEIDDLVKGQDEFESSMKSLIDTLYPMEAATRTFVDQLGDLRQYAEDNTWSAERLAAAEVRLAESFAEATRGIVDQKDKLSALDEGVRILERSFQSMWENILSGADNTWDSVLDGFRSLLARMIHEATTQKIVLGVQQAFGPSGGGVGDLFNMDFGGDLIAAAGTILGQSLAESDWGSIGSIALGIGGKWLGEQLGWWLGSLGGPLGLALGSALGAIIGDWVGGLFERKLAFTLGGENQRTRSDNQRITTPLGDILGLAGQGNFGSLNDPSSFGGQLAKALTEFDTQIAEFLKGFASDEQFNAVTQSLQNWVGSFGEGADAADVLSSRFRVILGNFSGDIQTFVNGAADFEEQLNRFGVALTADKLLRENPALFSGRSTGDILTLVAAFQSGAETMEDAFREFLTLFSRVAAVSDSLRSFANSNLAEDFAALGLDLTTAEALARVNSELMDAVATFDGSVDSFERIGTLAMLAREGELKLLSEIEAIQKGLNSNLDKLKADILGINAPDATGEQLFLEAQKLIGQITDQSSAADLAALEQQFNSIIRSIAPEDQLFMQSEILALIETFRARANPVFDARRNETLDNAQAMREMVDGFLVRIGDPLDIIAASLDGVNLQETMNDGLNAIDESVQQIGPQVAAALAQGLSQVSFTINLDGGGLVTQ